MDSDLLGSIGVVGPRFLNQVVYIMIPPGVMVDPSRLRVVPGTSGSEDLKATGKWGPRHVTFVQLAEPRSAV